MHDMAEAEGGSEEGEGVCGGCAGRTTSLTRVVWTDGVGWVVEGRVWVV